MCVIIWMARKVKLAFDEAKKQMFTTPSLIATVVHDLVIGALVAIFIGVRMIVLGLV